MLFLKTRVDTAAQPKAEIQQLTPEQLDQVAGGGFILSERVRPNGFVLSEQSVRPNGFILSE